jgi:hypothetical protein
VCVGVERGSRVLSSAGGGRLVLSTSRQCKSRSQASQLGLTRRRMRPKPFGAISCIPDGASPASTLASTSPPRHCTGNALAPRFGSLRYNTQRTQGTPCCYEPMPAPAAAHLPACLSVCLPITNARPRERHSDTWAPPTSHLLPLLLLLQDPSIVSPLDSTTHDSPLDVPPTASSL